MKIAIHAPFGTSSEESGILYLLVKYLRAAGNEVVQIRCNGIFSLCDRDADTNWKRGIQNCFRCMVDSRELAHWADLTVTDLSEYITPEVLAATKRWISFLPLESLLQARYAGFLVWDLVKGSFKNRFGLDQPELSNRNHEQVVRRLFLSAARMLEAVTKFNQQFKSDLIFVAGGQDFISHTLFQQSKQQSIPLSLVRWNLSQRTIWLSHPENESSMRCDLVLEGVSSMRSDIKTWPAEIVAIVEGLLGFLNLRRDPALLKDPSAKVAVGMP